jgi:hypothetical protein
MTKKNVQLFKEISVWKQIDDNTLLRYRCLQLLPDGRYCVKSSHFYHYPIKMNDELTVQAEFYFLDGMFQGGLVEAMKESFETIEEAIEKHEKDFDNS